MYARCTVLSLSSVDTAAQQWTGDLNIEFVFAHQRGGLQAMLDELERAENEKKGKTTFATQVFWFSLLNGVDVKREETWVRNRTDAADASISDRLFRIESDAGRVCGPRTHVALSVNVRCQATFAQRFDLGAFPFDTQTLLFRFQLQQAASKWRFAAPEDVCRLFAPDDTPKALVAAASDPRSSANLMAVDGRFSGSLSEWRLSRSIFLLSSLSPRDTSRTGTQYSHLTGSLLVKRVPLHYLLNYALPIVFVLISACLVPCVSDAGDRFAASSALLLSALAVKTQASEKTPALGEPTLLDEYIIGSCFLVFLMTTGAVGLDVFESDAESLATRASLSYCFRFDNYPMIAYVFLVAIFFLHFARRAFAAANAKGKSSHLFFCLDRVNPLLLL